MSTDDPGRSDSYGRAYVLSYLERPSLLITGLDLRVFSQMGDSLAATILKLLDSDQHLSQSVSETLFSKVLTAVGASMEYPSDIQDERDRIPSASLSLLRRLEPIAKSQEQRSRILNLITTLQANHELGAPDAD